MNTLELAQKHVTLRKVGSEWHGACPSCGAGKSGPERTDRFSVKENGRWFCRICTPEGGDEVAFLRKFENMNCPEAHAALDRECQSTTCPVLETCSKGRGQLPRQKETHQQRQTAKPKSSGPVWAPADATEPADLWRANAVILVEWAHKRLLAETDQLAYLASRGLPLDAVIKNKLGWWPDTKFKTLSSWGLPEEINNETGRPRRLWIPRGIVIPTFRDDQVDRIRIRRHNDDLADGRGKYVALKGSSDDVPVYGRDRDAFVVVESDLDGLLIDWVAGDMVGSIPLASCCIKPRSGAAAVLDRALCILVALDFEPRQNQQTGKHENPGGQSALWWTRTYGQSKRWPVPSGKDPGEFYEQGGDLRAWILQGLPPGLKVRIEAQLNKKHQVKTRPAVEQVKTDESEPVEMVCGGYVRGTSKHGRDYVVVQRFEDQELIRQQFPNDIIVLFQELQHLKGMTADETDHVLSVKSVFPECVVVGTQQVEGDGVVKNEAVFDPSRGRRSRWGSERPGEV